VDEKTLGKKEDQGHQYRDKITEERERTNLEQDTRNGRTGRKRHGKKTTREKPKADEDIDDQAYNSILWEFFYLRC
jgi:hypothetical protein